MADEFASSRLPDLPSAGYATRREKALSDNIMEFIRQIERDRYRLLTVVLGGRDLWKDIGGGILGRADGDLLNAIFDYLVLMAVPVFTRQQLLANLKNPAKCRDLLRDASPALETEREQLRLMAKWAPVRA